MLDSFITISHQSPTLIRQPLEVGWLQRLQRLQKLQWEFRDFLNVRELLQHFQDAPGHIREDYDERTLVLKIFEKI